MTQQNNIEVEVHPLNSDEMLSFERVNYISFISSPGGEKGGTYGIPAILSEDRYKSEGLPFSVLYVNPANVIAMLATRNA